MKLNKHLDYHIIFIGFKSVGKSLIGREVAARLHKSFIDLDQKIEYLHQLENKKKLSCRQIMNQYGQEYFRKLENQALISIINSKPSVISLGGGTLIHEENQKLIEGHLIIHIMAPRGLTFERIMMHGRPAYFSPDENPFDTFNKLWNEREQVYKKLANITIHNSGSINDVLTQLFNDKEL